MNRFDDYPAGAQRLILAAEQLVAERGVDGTSVREILRRARQGNNSAIYHHFGSKDKLIEAIYDLRQAEADRARVAWLHALGRSPRDLGEILDALLRPVLKAFQGQRRRIFAQMILHLILTNPQNPIFREERQPETTRHLNWLLRQCCPHLDDPLFHQRYTLAVLYLLQAAIYVGQRVAQGTLGHEDDEHFWNEIMQVVRDSIAA
ncbi:AcrR family transcriptional regulator [Sphingobium fontiphilum]|uniref:AcrR family transcriptional regulator n=1 Tax=Sphingobium fontiphilum TaxID=944425 RepID=A0A7W6DJ48_9SPHN|nr:TetR/AcrR family transcriptional regulator [Sphingobium fontiphilum]MBB3982286.1 AcrR family transcriptional regulator [Sphingobium fontiphilum]